MSRAMEMGLPWVLKTVRAAVGERPTCVSLDIDAASRCAASE